MSRQTWQSLYLVLSGAVFLLVAAFHLFRLICCWPIVVGTWTIPLWLSYFGLPAASAYCALAGLLLATRKRA